MYVQTAHTFPLCASSPSPPPPPPLVALNSSSLPSFILRCFLSSFLCPFCFLCHCSFRTGFVPWVISSGLILQPLFIQSLAIQNTGNSQEKLQKTNPYRQIQWHFWFCWTSRSPSNKNIPTTTFYKVRRYKVNLNAISLNCGAACFLFFFLQWFSASILHTTIVIYGNYPSLGSSINWLLLGDGSSCCLVGGSSTVRGNAGEFKRRRLWRKDETVLFF